MASTRQLPPWTPPTRHNVELPPLKVLNSFTKTKDAFIPADPTGKSVSWYVCGPTVYDDAHLGHARNYVSTDILRRIMKDYFGFQVKFVMNITDIDDKIILRARQQHLLSIFKEQHGAVNGAVLKDVIEATESAFTWYIERNLPLLEPGTSSANFSTNLLTAYKQILDSSALTEGEAKIKLAIKTATSAAGVIQTPPASLSEFYHQADDVLLLHLDSLHGLTIDPQNHGIFASLAKKFEIRFFEDMERLNVLTPDVITRVSDYVEQVVSFIEKVISNGFAYATSDGSVYFDINAFEKAGHFYARLEPWSRNDKQLQDDGEGALSKTSTATKHSDSDFALWKASKAGEPAWASPWGHGRPGWHVECSVMASEVIGEVMDLHLSGVDLKFPHNDNELAQSTAYWSRKGEGSAPWVNYFLHIGHLGIQGLKMSKSLKNFRTCREALESDWNPRSLRVAFLLNAWQDPVELGDELLASALAWESKLENIFLKAIDVTRWPSGTAPTQSDKEVLDSLQNAKDDLDAALCDSFNTPAAMRAISTLVAKVNTVDSLADDTFLSVARWITRMVVIFGLDVDGDLSDTERIGWSGVRIPKAAVPFVYPLSELRDTVRQQARSNLDHDSLTELVEKNCANITQSTNSNDASSQPFRDVLETFHEQIKSLTISKAPAKEFLALCDQLRDTQLPKIGIYIEDRPSLPAMVRPLNRSLAVELEQRKAASDAKNVEAQAKRDAEELKKRQKEEKAKVSHFDLFRIPEYSEWDDQGIPTKDDEGKEVTKSQRKKLVKEWERQKKRHEEWREKG